MASSRGTGSNENVSTYGSSGLGRDYTALATWEAATDYDLVTAEISEVLLVCRDEFPYDDFVNIAGATTNASYFRIVRGAYAEGVLGIPTSMAYISTSSDSEVFRIDEDYCQIQDIAAYNTSTGGSPSAFEAVADEVYFIGCAGRADTGGGAGIGFNFPGGAGAGTCYMINCLAWSCGAEGFLLANAQPAYAYNCTSVNNGTSGYSRSSGTFTCINCIGDTNTTADWSGTFGANSAYNASSDATAPTGVTVRTSQTFTYIDEANLDFHLAEDDAGARGYGTNMTADSVFPFDDDIDRELVVTWSIGWDSDGSFVSTADDCTCSGSFTEIGVGNGSLAYLGANLVTTWDATTKEGALLERLFAPVRRRLQQQYRWTFCLRRQSYDSTDVVSGVPDWGFDFAFLLPTNMLQLWEVGQPHENFRYRVENGYLLIDQSDIEILYSVEVTDPDLWSASYQEALELKLASKLAMPLLHKPEMMRVYEEMFMEKVTDAIFLNDIQSDDWSSYSSHFIDARRGFSPRLIPLDLS